MMILCCYTEENVYSALNFRHIKRTTLWFQVPVWKSDKLQAYRIENREDGCKIAPSNNCPNFITPLRTLHLIVIVILTKSPPPFLPFPSYFPLCPRVFVYLTQRDWSLMRLMNRGDNLERRTSGEVEFETIMKHSAQAFLMPQRLSEHRSKNLGIYVKIKSHQYSLKP